MKFITSWCLWQWLNNEARKVSVCLALAGRILYQKTCNILKCNSSFLLQLDTAISNFKKKYGTHPSCIFFHLQILLGCSDGIWMMLKVSVQKKKKMMLKAGKKSEGDENSPKHFMLFLATNSQGYKICNAHFSIL